MDDWVDIHEYAFESDDFEGFSQESKVLLKVFVRGVVNSCTLESENTDPNRLADRKGNWATKTSRRAAVSTAPTAPKAQAPAQAPVPGTQERTKPPTSSSIQSGQRITATPSTEQASKPRKAPAAKQQIFR